MPLRFYHDIFHGRHFFICCLNASPVYNFTSTKSVTFSWWCLKVFVIQKNHAHTAGIMFFPWSQLFFTIWKIESRNTTKTYINKLIQKMGINLKVTNENPNTIIKTFDSIFAYTSWINYFKEWSILCICLPSVTSLLDINKADIYSG